MARSITLCSALLCVLAVGTRASAAETGMLYAKSDPPGATVIIAGKERGKTPVLLKGLTPGEVTVELRYPGAKPVTKQVTVEAKRVAKIDVYLELPNASLTVISDPLEATVILNTTDVGKTPITIDDLAPGQHHLILLKTGHPRTVRDVFLKPGAQVTVDIKLGTAQEAKTGTRAPAEKDGTGTKPATKAWNASVTIVSDPPGATVFFDKRAVGKTPVTLANVVPGQHHAVLLMVDYPRAVRNVVLGRGAHATINVKFGVVPDIETEARALPGKDKTGTKLVSESRQSTRARFERFIELLQSPGDRADKAKICREHLAESPQSVHRAEIEALQKAFSARSGDEAIMGWVDYRVAYPAGLLRETALAELRRFGDALRARMKLALVGGDEELTGKLARAYLAALPQDEGATEIKSLLGILEAAAGDERARLLRKHIGAHPRSTFVGTLKGKMAAWSAKEEGEAFRRLMKQFAATKLRSTLLRAVNDFLRDHPTGPRAKEVRAARSVLALETARARLAAARKYVESYPRGAFVAAMRGLEADLARRHEDDMYRATMESVKSRETYAARLAATEKYFKEFPSGDPRSEHSGEVRRVADGIRALIAEEERAFAALSNSLEKIASTQDGIRMCEEFRRKYPGGAHVPEAASKLAALKRRLAGETETAEFNALVKKLGTKGSARASAGRITKAQECLRFLKRYRRGEHARQVVAKLKGFASEDLARHAGPVRAAAFSPDSKLLVTADADTGVPESGVRVWKLPGGELAQQYQSRPGFDARSAAFAPGDAGELWLGDASGCLAGWDISRGEVAWRYRLGPAPVSAISAHGESGAATVFLGDRKVRVWETADWSLRTSLPCPGGASAAAVSPAGNMVAVGGRDGRVAVFAVDTGEETWTDLGAHGGEVSCVAYSPNGLYVASCSTDDGTVAVWNAATGAKAWGVEDPSANVVFAADSAVLTGTGLRDVRGGRMMARLGGGGAVAASPDGVFAFTSDDEGKGKLWYLPALLWR